MDNIQTIAYAGQSTGQIKTLFADSSLGILIINNGGQVEFINNEAARIFGFDSTDDAQGYSLQNIDSVINCDLMEVFASVQNGSVFHKNEHRCTNRRGHFVVLDIHCSPYRQNNGSIDGLFAIIQDITSFYRKKAELESAIGELSIISQVAEALSSTADLDTALKIILTGVTANQGLSFNRAFLFMIDDNSNVLRGKMAVGPRNPEEAGKIWTRLARQPKTLTELLNDYIKRGDSSSFSLTSLITDWEISLNENTVFSRAIESATWTNIELNDDIDSGANEILKKLNTDHLAVAPIISKEKKLGLIAADNQITGKRIAESDMQLLQTFANNTAMAIEKSQLYQNLLEHAAELEEKNKLLARSQEQMVRVEKMSVIGELTSSIAHELRNPLAVIGGFANLMLSAGKNDANAEYINIILAEAKRAESVLHQVLDFSRASRTKSRDIDFNKLVQQTYELLLSRLKHSQKPPSLDLTEGKHLIWGNRDQLQHAFYQFMILSTEELTEECDVQIATNINEKQVRTTIEFEGSKNVRAKVIKTLHQIFNNPGGTYKLSIIVAGETIRYHGGDFGIESSPDELPKIFIDLPIKGGGSDG